MYSKADGCVISFVGWWDFSLNKISTLTDGATDITADPATSIGIVS